MRIPNIRWFGFDRCYRVVISGFIDIFIRESDAVTTSLVSLLEEMRCRIETYAGDTLQFPS